MLVELGDSIVAQPLEEALSADIVILAIPFSAHRDIGRKMACWNDKIVIDAMNTYGVPLKELGDRASTDVRARRPAHSSKYRQISIIGQLNSVCGGQTSVDLARQLSWQAKTVA